MAFGIGLLCAHYKCWPSKGKFLLFFSIVLFLQPLTVLMKQTRQAVCAVKQSILLDVYGSNPAAVRRRQKLAEKNIYLFIFGQISSSEEIE